MPSGSRFPTSLRLLADGVVAVLLAPACAACKNPLEHPTRGAVCDACWAAVLPTSPLGSIAIPPFIALATAIGPYDERLKDIVHALKYDPRPTIARHLAARMREAGAEILSGADIVVPVPLHRARERARGFNQARELARHLGLPVVDALIRMRNTESQADLPAAKRQRNVDGAFAIGPGVSVTDRIVVLIDDVSTTGAPLNACASSLLDAGAQEVRALTAARASLRASTASEPRERSRALGPRE